MWRKKTASVTEGYAMSDTRSKKPQKGGKNDDSKAGGGGLARALRIAEGGGQKFLKTESGEKLKPVGASNASRQPPPEEDARQGF